MADQEAGFNIWNTFYPWPTSIRTVDPVLVVELTGMDFVDWAEALDDADAAVRNPVIRLGLIGVAVWQANPRWKRQRVVDFLSQLENSEIEFVGGEEVEESPPAESPVAESSLGAEDNSPTSPEKSNGSQVPPAEPSSPTSSGLPGSVTGAPA
jgi:hypothetical protein